MKQTPQEARVTDIVKPIVEENGYRLVLLKITQDDKHGAALQIYAEDPKTKNLKLEDCSRLSREISDVLDVEDPISGRFRLEVSSPGIDRPLISLEDFEDHIGLEVKIEIDPPIEGRKRFRGRIKKVEEQIICLEFDNQEAYIPHAVVQKAKLVMNDELMELKHKRA